MSNTHNPQRRRFLGGAALAATVATAGTTVARSALAALPEAPIQTSADTQAPWTPPGVTGAGRPYNPVVTLNGWTLPWRMKNGVKEFHLIAEPVVREMAPGFLVNMWGYNGQSPGPTIEVVEGDKVRIFVTNRLPEHTTIHWHGQRLPNGMDGVGGLNQPQIPACKTFVYEFEAKRPGTFMYHPHADEMTQMAMGMMGFWVTHPKQKHAHIETVQRDYCFLLNAFDLEPGSMTPKVNTMLDFNIWSWNSRVFPAISPLVARLGELLGDVLEESAMMVEKKQARTYDEIERDLMLAAQEDAMEVDEDEDEDAEEKPIYNPLNLPLGWDGKPIPYWLYKLHGLNLEFKCEICGNYSYWGPRPFERHFQEWRHAYGMKCLGIPNSKPFQGITLIEDAYTLWAKLKAEKGTTAFQADTEEEFEDGSGNVMTRKVYTDLARQGLLD